MFNLMQSANGRWESILSNFIDREFLTNKHGPCPMCGGKDRFRFDDKEGNGTYYCSACGSGSGWKLLSEHQGISMKDAAELAKKLIDTSVKREKKKFDTSKLPAQLWNKSEQVEKGDDVSLYLNSRGILEIPKTIRKVTYQDHVCMIAKASKGKRPVGIHLTFLKEGRKATLERSKRMIKCADMGGSVLRLQKPVKRVLVAEGIETALSAGQMFRIPAWAYMTEGNMKKGASEIPEGMEVLIAGDNDTNYVGQAAAYELARALSLKGYKVEVKIPADFGDWNDVLMGQI